MSTAYKLAALDASDATDRTERESGSLEAASRRESLTVDLNEASVHELRALPGIGEVLANRIVAYRQEHGRFEQATELTRVPGITEKRLSKFAPSLSISPANSDFRQPAAAPAVTRGPIDAATGEPVPEGYVTMPLFSISSDVLRGQLPPSMASLLPGGPVEPSWSEQTPITLTPERPFSLSPRDPERSHGVGSSFSSGDGRSVGGSLAPPDERSVGGSLAPLDERSMGLDESFFSLDDRSVGASLAPLPVRSKRPLEVIVDDTSDDDFVPIPLQKPWKVWLILSAIGFFSATVGAVFGMRSQDGGPRAFLERRMGRVQDDVTDLQTSVRNMSGQNEAIVSSINSLDERLAQQEQKQVAPPPTTYREQERRRAPSTSSLDASETESPKVARPSPPRTRAGESSRRALESLDSLLPPSSR